jgi:hypothetical protein
MGSDHVNEMRQIAFDISAEKDKNSRSQNKKENYP